MPFESKAQQRFMFAKHPEMAKEWADKTPGISALPEHVKKMAEGGTPDAPKEGDEFTEGIKSGVNHDSDAVKSYLASKFAQMLHPGMGEGTAPTTPIQPPSAIGQTPTSPMPENMADGGFPHVTFMEDQTPEENAKTTHLAKEPVKMAEGGKTPHFLGGLKKGALHKELGVSEEHNIPEKKLEHAANSDNETLRKRAQFAINAKKWNHADGSVIQKAEDRNAEPSKPKDVDMSHEKKLNSIYKAMGIKKYADGGEVDTFQLPNGVQTPDSSDPSYWDKIKTALSQITNGPAGQIASAVTNPIGAITGALTSPAATNLATTEGKAVLPVMGAMAGVPASPTPPPPAVVPPTTPPVNAAVPPVISPAPPAGGTGATPSGMPNLSTIFNQDTSKLTQGVNPEDRQALVTKLHGQQEGLGAIIAQAVSGIGDALAAKGGKEQHSLQNIFSMDKTQRDETMANFDAARQARIQKLQLQTQMGDNALKQAAAADAYGVDEHLNDMIGAPKGTMKKDLPTYFSLMSAQVAAQEKNADLYMKAHAQAGTDVDNAVKNSSVLGIKPSPAQLQASGAKLADQYYNRAKGNILVKPSDGGQAQWIPAQSLNKAKQMDPNLTVQP